jgi:hypothetical protein
MANPVIGSFTRSVNQNASASDLLSNVSEYLTSSPRTPAIGDSVLLQMPVGERYVPTQAYGAAAPHWGEGVRRGRGAVRPLLMSTARCMFNELQPTVACESKYVVDRTKEVQLRTGNSGYYLVAPVGPPALNEAELSC